MPSPLLRMRPRADVSHGWLGTETVKRVGTFAFRNSYPANDDVAQQLHDALVFNRAVELFLTHMPLVSWFHVWKGIADAGARTPNQVVIWETLMDSATLLLTGNTETVYALAPLDLKRDGPVVVEVPASMLGGINDLSQTSIAEIGITGVDKGRGGRFLILPPDHDGQVHDGYFTVRSRTYRGTLGLRGFQGNGGTSPAVDLMKTTRIYPYAQAGNPPQTTFVNASRQAVDTLFTDDARFYDDLAWIVAHEPSTIFASHERFQLAAIGIEKGVPFKPDERQRRMLDEAARFASAVARTNSFASTDPARLAYPDRLWEWAFIGGSATWDSQGYVNTDRRAAFAYIAIGMSPAMVEKHVGAGSQYLWTPRDARGAFLDGGRRYCLRIPPNIPVKNFWSVVAYDADSRSILKNDQPFPSVSSYTNPRAESNGAIDIYFGPNAPPKGKNWIQTMPGKGWFVLFRFYGPLDAFFDKTWKPDDIIEVK